MYTEQTGIETVQGTKKILKSFFYPVKSVYVLRLTEVHLLVEYDQGKPFPQFPEEVTNVKRDVDKDSLKKIAGSFVKLKGNSVYGSMVENLSSHKSTKFLCDEWDVKKALRFHFFGGIRNELVDTMK